MIAPLCDKLMHELSGDRCALAEGHEGKCRGAAMTPEAFNKVWRLAELQREEDDVAWPTTAAALGALFRARDRLKRLGWSEAIYCPKDGSMFAYIEYGSTGIFGATYTGDWPTGSIYSSDCFSHPNGGMWKALDKLTEDEFAKMKHCDADTAAYIDRLGRSFGDQP